MRECTYIFFLFIIKPTASSNRRRRNALFLFFVCKRVSPPRGRMKEILN
jgi:hypothetical protein